MRALAVGLLVTVQAVAAGNFEPFVPDVQQRLERTPVADDIDHLVPVTGRTVPEFYYLAQFSSAVSIPYGESYWVLWRELGGHYYIRYADQAPERRDWGLPVLRGAENLVPRGVRVKTSEAVASLVYEIWVNALLQTRYTETQYRGVDGGEATFSTFIPGTGWLHGAIWSPRAQAPPLWIWETAEYLKGYARRLSTAQDEASRSALDTECRTRLAEVRGEMFAYWTEGGRTQNHPAPGKAGTTSPLTIEPDRSGLPDPGR